MEMVFWQPERSHSAYFSVLNLDDLVKDILHPNVTYEYGASHSTEGATQFYRVR